MYAAVCGQKTRGPVSNSLPEGIAGTSLQCPLYKISCFCSSQNPLASSTFPFFFIFWSLYAKPRRMSSMGLRSAGVLLGYSRSLTDRPLFHLFTIMACHQMARLHFHQLRPLLPAAFTGKPAAVDEPAALRRVHRAGELSLQTDPLLLFLHLRIRDGDRGKQRLGIWVHGIGV